MNKTDLELKHDIDLELRWDPQVNPAQIGVGVEHGSVSLLGEVDTYAEKWAAEAAVKRVSGVRFVAENLTVKLLGEHVRTDADIAAAMEGALMWNVLVPKAVTARVQNGWITLDGAVTSHYQRKAAEFSVRHLTGVVGVTNAISLIRPASSTQVKEKVEQALQRQATADAKSIKVEASGGKVTLSGHASSWRAIEDATNAAWAAPGVFEVDDQVQIATAG
ncbi:MAG: hypothetical protein JWN48_3179 [Myxococcaceae bacterium]|nr:hypothetical protein [Myxococcaceae bacterium]